MVYYNKYLASRNNITKILPYEPNKIFFYYLGAFERLNNVGVRDEEYLEVENFKSGSGITNYFPLVIERLNARGNWKFLTTEDAKNIHYLDFCWTNSSYLNSKSSVLPRFLLDSIYHYLSNKCEFYSKFKDYDFIPANETFTKDSFNTKQSDILNKFNNKPVIIKPALGFMSKGILVQNKLDINKLNEHISKFDFDEWVISEIIKSKLHNNFINTNRTYILIVKEDDREVKCYYYRKYLTRAATNPFTGDFSDPSQMLTNLITEDDLKYDFLTRRTIRNHEREKDFTKSELEKIKNQYIHIYKTIAHTLVNDLVSYNDNKLRNTTVGYPNLISDKIMSFHIYGIDTIIDDNCNVKILEVNGAPMMNINNRLFKIYGDVDYADLFEEVFQKTLDKIFPPKNIPKFLDNFELVYNGFKEIKNTNNLFYIPNSITQSYPFILYALRKRNYIKRTKNMYDKIDFFYGLREKYVTDETNLNYYDELLNFLTSKRMRKAGVINKIQGVTYYLANKGNLYDKLLDKYSEDIVHDFHPVSKNIYFENKRLLLEEIRIFINKYPNYRKWIVKPVHGSQGKGIKIFERPHMSIFTKIFRLFKFNPSNDLIDNIAEHIIANSNDYKYWMISQYIDNPHLIKLPNDIQGRKYNLRFYVLLTINKNLPTYKDLNSEVDNTSYIRAYIWKDLLIYFAMLEYYCKHLPHKYDGLSNKKNYLDKMTNLTNLEIINNVFEELYSKYSDSSFDKVNREHEKANFTNKLSNIYPNNSPEFNYIFDQAKRITKCTINSVKYDLRPLNRYHDNFKGCFNLLAFDSLLDENGNLWLIEVNRGPDMKALLINLGMDECTNIFDEIFKITIDSFLDNQILDENKLKYFEPMTIKYNVVKS